MTTGMTTPTLVSYTSHCSLAIIAV